MNLYLWIKWLHIVSSVVLVGTGFGSAFYLFFANRSGSAEAQAWELLGYPAFAAMVAVFVMMVGKPAL